MFIVLIVGFGEGRRTFPHAIAFFEMLEVRFLLHHDFGYVGFALGVKHRLNLLFRTHEYREEPQN